jgi:hypothetical protein
VIQSARRAKIAAVISIFGSGPSTTPAFDQQCHRLKTKDQGKQHAT